MTTIELQALNEALSAENAQLQLENREMHARLAGETLRANQGWERYESANRRALASDNQVARIRQETIEECAKVCEDTNTVTYRNFERLDDAQGTLYAAADRIRSLPQGAGQPQHLPVQAGKPLEGWTIASQENGNWLINSPSGDSAYVFADDLSPLGEVCRQLLQSLAFGAYVATSCPPSSAQGDEQDEEVLHEWSGWYCPHCQRGCDPSEVTFREYHQECGTYIGDAVPPAALQSAAPIEEREALKDREIREAVNQLVEVARNFYSAQQLRSRIQDVVLPLVKRAALSAPAIPEGHVIVPIEPTKEMQEAGEGFIFPYDVYQEMLAAAQIPASPKIKNHSENLDSGKTGSADAHCRGIRAEEQ